MKKILLSLILGITVISQLWAQKADKSQAVYVTKDGAIQGYDPVAYFTENKPVKGHADIKTDWNGATWYFASASNKALFEQHPEQYAPQFGGWCAYGWAQGYPAKTEPEAWTISGGKLYLNYDLKVQKMWNKNQAAFIEQAIKNYTNRKK